MTTLKKKMRERSLIPIPGRVSTHAKLKLFELELNSPLIAGQAPRELQAQQFEADHQPFGNYRSSEWADVY